MNIKTVNNQPNNNLGFSPDALAQRKAELLALIRQTVPEVMADNQLNVEKLKALLGHEHIAPDEHYELKWAGKSAARREIQKASSLTLRPDANNPPNAEHMLIEGENLEVLRVLQKSYYGKVKMIYIDPPYNTGNDSFVYPDDYSETLEEYQKRTGEKNEAGYLNKQSLWKKNGKESGQYHSAWLSMMYPRLYLARNLLRDDGVIFISIDDNEAANLKLLCDEVFGVENFVVQIIWKKRSTPPNDKIIGTQHDYILCYQKSDINGLTLRERNAEQIARYRNPDSHPKGPWTPGDLMANVKGGRYVASLHYPITNPRTGQQHYPSSNGNWRFNKEKVEKLIADNEIYFGEDDGGRPKLKRFLSEVKEGMTWTSLWDFVALNTEGSEEMASIFGNMNTFDNPKPVDLIGTLLKLGSKMNGIVVDFFSGSGTTAHSVMKLNLEDGGTRQTISVQMPEVLDEDCEAYKAGYRTISDITRARIDKVIAKLKAEHPDKTRDLACAFFTLAPSNFRVWRGDIDSTKGLREQLSIFQSAEKTAQNQQADLQTAMLTEILLKHGLGALGVHSIAKPRVVAGVTVHRVLMADDKTMWLCFETYDDALKDEIVKAMPAQVVMLNSCFVGPKADEQLANLQLELAGLDISLTLI
jgi:adenine-specific DNA-methyltransferase